ncbi:MAG TPA: DUF2007 domain-containing protein [Salinimicrobium sp.]|nr:DUF2007 domain-containing protein [Salinimicrobium sp.]
MEYKTIYRTTNQWEISIIKNLLDERQIAYLVPEEVTSNAYGFAGLGMLGMRIQVLEHQQKEAIAILKERGFS